MYADMTLVSTPDLLEFVGNSRLLPQPSPFKIKKIPYKISPFSSTYPLKIVHAPSSMKIKGTEYLIKAVSNLKTNGFFIDLILLTGMSHEIVLSELANCHLAVDQLLIGSYGSFAVEAMSLGRPVICYIRSDLKTFYPSSLPVINSSPNLIEDTILHLYNNPEDLIVSAESSLMYSMDVHDQTVIAELLLSYYKDLF
jgi:glycosyltransferase involved in cell wall biosynthesis